jgi:prolyl oligopeptidase
VKTTDPYGWLEVDSREALAWQSARNEEARNALRSWSGYDQLRELLEPLVAEGFLSAPSEYGNRWFQTRFEAQGVVLAVADAPVGDGRVLLAADAFRENDRPVSLDWFYPSPNGRYVAFGVSFDGDEQSILHVIETDTARLGPERIPFTSLATVAWLPDSSGFYYNASIGPDWESADKQIFFHRLGDQGRPQPEALDVRQAYSLFPQVSADGRWVAAVTSELEPRADYLKEIGGDDWRPFLVDVDGYCFGAFVGDRYVAISTEGAPRGRVVSIPIASASDRSTWKELVPESEAVLRLLVRVGDHLVLCSLVDAASRLTVLSLDGREQHPIALPGEGVVHTNGLLGSFDLPTPASDPHVVGASDSIAFVFATFDRSSALYRYRFAERRLEQLRAPAMTENLVSRRAVTRARDGVEVVYRLHHRADIDLAEPQPTLLYGYGGWNIALVRGYLGIFMPVVEAGGIVVFAHLRGGGEFGRQFWFDGRHERKQNSFDDLYAVAEALVETGVATHDRVAVAGGSNGGLLTGVALVQRPELWCAVASLVPVYDMLEFTRDSYTATGVLEYGNPADPMDAEILRAYSPYHTVPEAAAFPPTLVYCGANDMRCPPWHSRKFAARVADANTADTPILLRAHEHGGHMTTHSDPEQAAEWIGFLMRELGLEPAS